MSNRNRNNSITTLTLIVILFLITAPTLSQGPQAFTLIRSIPPSLPFDQYLSLLTQSTPNPNPNPNSQIPSGYNLVSLAGFTETSTYQGLDSELSPLMVWKKVYEIVLGGKPTVFGAGNREVQREILGVFRANGGKLLMHCELDNFPVSGPTPVSPTNLAQQLATTVTQLQLDGLSISFTDHNSLKDNTASDFLETLLRTLRLSTQNTNLLILLILPPTFPPKLRLFKISEITLLIDYLILKYYGTVQPDYTNYRSIFQAASFYAGTGVFQGMARGDLYFDACRTLVSKPVDQGGSWNYMQYMTAADLNGVFGQAYTRYGWFAGFANLNYEADKDGKFVNAALAGLREQCARNQNCFC